MASIKDTHKRYPQDSYYLLVKDQWRSKRSNRIKGCNIGKTLAVIEDYPANPNDFLAGQGGPAKIQLKKLKGCIDAAKKKSKNSSRATEEEKNADEDLLDELSGAYLDYLGKI